MKFMKKLFMILAVMVMAMAMTVTAMAETINYSGDDATQDGSITITNATVGATYKAYKLFDATVGSDGEIAYTLPSGKSLENNTWFELADNGTNVVAKAGADVTTEAFKTWAASFGREVASTGSNGAEAATVKFDKLPYGYYVITSTVAGGAKLTLTSTKPTATVIDKNKTPSWDNGDENPGKVIVEGTSKVTSNSARFGEDVSFDIGINGKNYNGDKKIKEYYIFDTLDAGLTYKTGTGNNGFTVKVGNTVLASEAYTITVSEQSFSITVPWINEDGSSKYADDTEIHVTYQATVNSNAAIAGNGNKNTAWFDWKQEGDSEGPYDPENPYHKSEDKTTTTYVYAIGIKKTDGKNKTLEGAEFTVKDSANNEVKVKETDQPGVYEVDATGTSTVVSPSSGLIIIKGIDKDTFSLQETKAPAGYNLKKDATSVSADLIETSSTTETVTTYYDSDGNVVSTETEADTLKTKTLSLNVAEVVIVNQAGTELPSTGGMGTTVFYVLGGILLAAAAVLLITRKRMQNR
ncbi:MAG: isopeptide-forming domain-containing fimbrial protein [Lachnospiraceae bacterium]|nr:isopeptide-forming domain-containing fimbrial protein [Lachnospiraceae bacterium]